MPIRADGSLSAALRLPRRAALSALLARLRPPGRAGALRLPLPPGGEGHSRRPCGEERGRRRLAAGAAGSEDAERRAALASVAARLPRDRARLLRHLSSGAGASSPIPWESCVCAGRAACREVCSPRSKRGGSCRRRSRRRRLSVRATARSSRRSTAPASARPSASALELGDLDLGAGELLVRDGKGRKDRLVPLRRPRDERRLASTSRAAPGAAARPARDDALPLPSGTTARGAGATADRHAGGARGADRPRRHDPRAAAHLRHAARPGWRRHPPRAGTPRATAPCETTAIYTRVADRGPAPGDRALPPSRPPVDPVANAPR